MNDFWARKREELQQEGVIPTPRPSVMSQDGPWWQEPRNKAVPPTVPQQPSQRRTGPLCPHCQSENYMKPSSSMAARCFECGYVDGRQLNEPNLPGIAVPDAATLKVKQLQSGGHFGRSAQEIATNNAVLEQSAQGKTKLD